MTTIAPARQIGRSIPRLEARAKVTGRAEYAHNLRLPGMLFGKVCRSTVAHGRIRAIDTLAAGDVFHAGFVLGLIEGREIAAALRFAAAAAAVKCTRFGGSAAAPRRAEVDAMLAGAP